MLWKYNVAAPQVGVGASVLIYRVFDMFASKHQRFVSRRQASENTRWHKKKIPHPRDNEGKRIYYTKRRWLLEKKKKYL
jgi:hypothetical protein